MRQASQKKYTSLLLMTMLSISLMSTLLLAKPVMAQVQYETGWQIIPKECLDKQGANDEPCGLNSFINLFVNLAKVGLKVLPYLTMIMMIWAGFNLIMAGGNAQKIEEGKRMVSSVVIGAVIVLFLAWAFSYFIVYILTCDPQKPATCQGKIFPNYKIWEKEWWGGGTANTTTASLGCCVSTASQWCQEQLNEDDCVAQGGSFHGQGSSCATDAQAACANFAEGCCVPDTSGGTCHSPDSVQGCRNYPGYTLNQNQTCGQIYECFTSSTGCCVPDNPDPDNQQMWRLCGPATAQGDCTAYPDTTVRSGLRCNDFPICKAGCCVPRCSAGLDQASEYWCNNSGLGAASWHFGTCTDTETQTAGCCAVATNADGGPNQTVCYSHSNLNNDLRFNKQYCTDLGGTWDDQDCPQTGFNCDTFQPISNDLCGL